MDWKYSYKERRERHIKGGTMQSLSSSDLQQYIHFYKSFFPTVKESKVSLIFAQNIGSNCTQFGSQGNPLFSGRTSQWGLGLKWRLYKEGVGWCSFIYNIFLNWWFIQYTSSVRVQLCCNLPLCVVLDIYFQRANFFETLENCCTFLLTAFSSIPLSVLSLFLALRLLVLSKLFILSPVSICC